ncbi:MAG: recombinase RecA [Elusimicrobia bacterium GWA2_61_42]|nr:MAG: recombinase RecA [Elusimicrobia bacterium GWA2_61_42]OGR76442.1 MAG: recombinase RecA [Elusimicrobia bacterium GWC2_61_25]
MATEEKNRALEAALSQIEKSYGKEAIMKLGERSGRMKIETIPTGALSLDLALGVGGLPRGRVIEIYGPESSGKTTLTLHVIAEAQKKGGMAAFIDAEHALDPVYAQRLGVDVDNLLISQPDSGEQALEICEKLVRSGALDIIVIDSVAALVPKAEIEGEMGDMHVGLQARLMSQALRKLTSIVASTKTSVMFINQLRHKIGVMFGNPETTPGGLALKFYSSVRLDIRKIETIKQADVVTGARIRVKVVKNKVAPPYRQAEFEMVNGEGISTEGCLLDMGVETGLLEKSGTWYIYNGDRMGQGRENAKLYLKANKDKAAEIEKELRSRFLMPGMKPTAGSEKVAAEKAAEKAADKAYAEKKEKAAKK